MIINHHKEFIFTAVAKTGCTSIQRRFGLYQDPEPDIYHMHLSEIIKQNPETKDYFQFAFVRNPYDRLISAYFDFKNNPQHKDWAFPIYKYDSFGQFVEDLYDKKFPEDDWIHLHRQFDYLQVDGKVNLDYVGRFETLQQDMKNIESLLGLKHTPLNKERSSRHDHFASYYTTDIKRMVYEIYEEDFMEFGYEE